MFCLAASFDFFLQQTAGFACPKGTKTFFLGLSQKVQMLQKRIWAGIGGVFVHAVLVMSFRHYFYEKTKSAGSVRTH